MKILHLLDEPWDSGLSAYAIDICRLLKQSGHTVRLGVRPGKKPETLAQQKGIDTVPVFSFFSCHRVLHGESWDVVNAHTGRTHTWAYLCLALSTRRSHRPILIRTRGDARPISSHPGTAFIYHRTDGFIAASQHVASQFSTVYPLIQPKMSIIYPSVECQNFFPGSVKPHVVGLLGRLDPVKGHSVFLEAAARVLARIPTATFLVAGPNANIPVSLLENQTRQLNILKSVQFLGFLPSVSEFMSRCTLGVIPSLGSEEVSRVCLEWMASGKPVVASLVGCLPELVDTDETGLLVPPNDFVSLADAIIELLKDPVKAEKMGRQALQVARRRFSQQTMLSETLSAYDRARQKRT